MISNVVVFDTAEDLMSLTGIQTYEGLWEAGFNMDDWDWGVVLDEPMHDDVKRMEHHSEFCWIDHLGKYHHEDAYDEEVTECQEKEEMPYWMRQLYWNWENYCVGGSHNFYNGKHYYMWHHS